MTKGILIIFLIYFVIGIGIWYLSYYTPISKQIDVKTMSFTNPNYIYRTYSECVGDCTNYSSDSSRGGSSRGGGISSGK